MPLLAIGSGGSSSASSTSGPSENVNLKTFRDLIGDVARSYLFQIVIPQIDESKPLTLLAKSTILPAYSLEDKHFDFQGSQYKQAGHATFDDWNVTFISDEYQKIRHKFLAWQSLIYDPIRQIPFTAGSYKKNDVKVFQLSKDGNIVTGYEFFGIYPKRVGEINLDQGGNELSSFTVTFAYDYFILNTEDDKKSPNEAKVDSSGYSVKIQGGKNFNDYESLRNYKIKDKGHISNRSDDNTRRLDGARIPDIEPLSNFKISKARISNRIDDITLRSDGADNTEIDYNSKGRLIDEEGALVSFLQNINPFGRKGDINTPDPATFLDYANWIPYRYSPPIGFRIRKFLPSGINKSVDSVRVPNINPYAWTGLEKPK